MNISVKILFVTALLLPGANTLKAISLPSFNYGITADESSVFILVPCKVSNAVTVKVRQNTCNVVRAAQALMKRTEDNRFASLNGRRNLLEKRLVHFIDVARETRDASQRIAAFDQMVSAKKGLQTAFDDVFFSSGLEASGPEEPSISVENVVPTINADQGAAKLEINAQAKVLGEASPYSWKNDPGF